MNLQPEDFWSFYEWLIRPGAFLESAALQGVVLIILSVVLGLIAGYLISAARHGPGEGFFAVARVVKDLVMHDLPGTSLRRIFALAGLAFKEAIRHKVLFVVGLFLVLLLLAGWYLNPDSDDPARLYISFVLTATNYLVLVLALFISAFSIPAEIKSRTMYTIVTKPVRPTEIVLGRMLGFIGVGTLILVPMGLSSYLFVTRGLRHTHVEITDVQELKDGTLVGETDFVRNHKHTFTIDPDSGGQGLTNFSRGHQHIVTRNTDGTFTVGLPDGALRARVPVYGDIEFFDRAGQQQEEGIDVGQEQLAIGYANSGVSRLVGITKEARKTQHGYIEGGTLGFVEYTFSDVTRSKYPEGLPLDLSIRAYRSFKGNVEKGVSGSIALKHPVKGTESVPEKFVVVEYGVDEKMLPWEIIVTEEVDGKNQEKTIDIFDDYVSDQGQVSIVIRCLDREQYLGMTRSGVYLRPAENSFGWNLTKSYISIWLQMTMVIAFGVMFSTFLSGPVAMVATGVCVLLGFAAEMISDTRHFIDSNVERGGGPIESFIRLVRQDAMTTQLDLEATAVTVIKAIDAGIVYTLDAVATALPNLPKMVQTAEYAASGFDIFGVLLMRHGAATFGYCVLAFMVSYFFLKTREIAA